MIRRSLVVGGLLLLSGCGGNDRKAYEQFQRESGAAMSKFRDADAPIAQYDASLKTQKSAAGELAAASVAVGACRRGLADARQLSLSTPTLQSYVDNSGKQSFDDIAALSKAAHTLDHEVSTCDAKGSALECDPLCLTHWRALREAAKTLSANAKKAGVTIASPD